jgi:hypothetical protein
MNEVRILQTTMFSGLIFPYRYDYPAWSAAASTVTAVVAAVDAELLCIVVGTGVIIRTGTASSVAANT